MKFGKDKADADLTVKYNSCFANASETWHGENAPGFDNRPSNYG